MVDSGAVYAFLLGHGTHVSGIIADFDPEKVNTRPSYIKYYLSYN